MSYTPTVWQTGDTITAEKLNKLEGGVADATLIDTEETVLFSGSVTTEEHNGIYGAQIDCDLSDSPEQIKVTFDGTEYTCEKIDNGGGLIVYGGFGESGPDFSEYPFGIVCVTGNSNSILTETAGAHQVEITAVTRSINQDIGNLFPLIIKNETTNFEEMEDALARNRLMYFVQANKYYFITDINPISFIPEDNTIGISVDPDGTIIIGGG